MFSILSTDARIQYQIDFDSPNACMLVSDEIDQLSLLMSRTNLPKVYFALRAAECHVTLGCSCLHARGLSEL